MTLSEIQAALNQASAQAGAIARSHNDGELRILAIAIAETARATSELTKLLAKN
jgi:hypothetical protein